MIRTILLTTFVIFTLSGCFHQQMMKPKKEEMGKRPHYNVPKLNPSFYYN